MSEQKLCMITVGAIVSIAATYLMASSFYHITPAHHRTIWTQFQRVKYNETGTPGLHWKSPFVTGINMFVGRDKDEVSYNCGTKDGITFSGTVAITNQLLPGNVLPTYLMHGRYPDKAHIYDNAEFIMQGICAEKTAREFLLDNFNENDELLGDKLEEAQIRGKSGLIIHKDQVKVFRPVATNSDIENSIKMEAEHLQSTLTAHEKQQLNKKMAILDKDKQKANDELSRARNIADQLRKTDTQETELAREKIKLKAEKERAEIRHEMDKSAAAKEAAVKVIKATANKDAGLLLAIENEAKLTDAYLREQEIIALSQNNKIYYGANVGDVFRLHNQV